MTIDWATFILRVMGDGSWWIARRRGPVDGRRGRHRRAVVETHRSPGILWVLGKMWWRAV